MKTDLYRTPLRLMCIEFPPNYSKQESLGADNRDQEYEAGIHNRFINNENVEYGANTPKQKKLLRQVRRL